MTIPESEPHVAAVLAKLEAELPASMSVALGVGPAGDRPYAVLYADGRAERGRLSGDRSVLSMLLTVKVVGSGPEQALWALDRVREVMLGDPPTVAERVIHRLTEESTQDLERDDGFQPPLYLLVSTFRLMSQAAA